MEIIYRLAKLPATKKKWDISCTTDTDCRAGALASYHIDNDKGTAEDQFVHPQRPRRKAVVSLWWTYKKQWKMAIEIVDFPVKNGDFPWQNVSSPEGIKYNHSSTNSMSSSLAGSSSSSTAMEHTLTMQQHHSSFMHKISVRNKEHDKVFKHLQTSSNIFKH